MAKLNFYGIFTVFLARIIFILLLCEASAGEIKGKIINNDRENLKGVTVKVYQEGNLISEEITNKSSYKINLYKGNYYVVITLPWTLYCP
ncbi:MAG: hypothetical protein GW779_05470 [Candidatus Altiarchaeum hamiconexum]|uniref:Carboxypeptidase regulatory-like domain-containing protein n=1 Tax=Candidatus Altarchaeum hamiconexum TaxID=1803513 RepID=A0A8J8CI65_9ARCH|nr:hypothetical protein [Candidatus Altarchaeum hamiconexum]OIQ05676.1 MAG: hypothetical protein AUK59_02970 [Candidatus Altarchaeum sp. CG2_30_32_3053]PIN67350.1 MAG: hypothetical protein COV98_03340 [Candidatus Altarchaeum sp. CG12_big_fil_rev_8_21_14_0_65_33_22]PIV28026.1 MAG: hypothetical protein COS36_03645 [Candidatus Altarchaeum sp. CG03_land_8_20_14_0_80_32_618]PIX48683.1 MAG: hypothetical protein COZ53_03285 [Candidatus Altarchaeum sp. CG_4_8_14_3_um_filter_33_2054]PIZ32937.1 MAG: hyp